MNAFANASLASLSPSSPATFNPADAPSILSARAVLIRPSIRQWTARKLDKRASAQITALNGADVDAARVHKSLVAKSALAAIQLTASQARDFCYAETLPWGDDGARLLPSAKYDAVSLKLTEYRRTFETQVSDFIAAYPAERDAAEHALGSMFNPADYPKASEIASRFSFNVKVSPIPRGDDFRVTVSAETRAAVEADATAALREAMREVAARIRETVGHMANKLRNYSKSAGAGEKMDVFRDSLISNVAALADELAPFNLANDPALDAAISAMRGELTRHDAATLRENADLRRDVAETAQGIVDHMSAYFA